MAQKTAVEWLEQEIKKLNIKVNGAIQVSAIRILEQAKQREKEQKEEEYKRGWEDATSTGIKEAHKYQ